MKISRKLSIWTVVALLAAGLTALFVHSRILVSAERDEFAALANTVGPIIEEGLVHSMFTRDQKLLNHTLRNLEGNEPINRIVVVDPEGIVRAGTDPAMEGKRISLVPGSYHKQPEARPGSVLDDVESFRWVQSVRNRKECYGCHSEQTRYNGAVVIDFSTLRLERHVRSHITKEFVVFLGAFLTVGIVTFFLSNTIIIKRLGRVISAVDRFKDGDHEARLTPDGGDEIAVLADGFNAMADAISRSQGELERYAGELLSLAVSTNVVTAVPRTEDIYEAVCNIAVKEMKLGGAWVGAVKPDGTIETLARSGFGADGASGRREEDTIALVIKTTSSHVANDGEEGRSFMALPLLTSDSELVGVLSLASNEPRYFTPKRMRLFTIFSNQVSAAIENRMLIEDAERTSRKLTEQFKAILRSQKEWRLTFDSITDLISIHDRDYRVIKANKAFSEYFGREPKDVVNNVCWQLFEGMCSPDGVCPHRVSLAERRVATEEMADPRTNRTFQVSTFPYYSADGEFIGSVHIAKDVTEVREKEMRLIMSERLASLGQMASGLAHEINNPLASIGGCAEGLLLKVKRDRYEARMFEEYLTIIQEEVQRCKQITTGMLSFVRKASYEKKDIDLNRALDKALEIIGFQGRLRDVTIARRYRPDLPVVHGSEGELRQVFLALLTNALDAMGDNGTLTIETGADKDHATLTISDTGPGIPVENLGRIFDPFFTTKSDRGGTGLGLSIVHKIVTNHNGTIEARSCDGGGASFIVTLPLNG